MTILTMYQGAPIAKPQTETDLMCEGLELAHYIRSQMELGRQVLISPDENDAPKYTCNNCKFFWECPVDWFKEHGGNICENFARD